jgi:sugar transferase (PEP-CTERM system associated)
VNALSDRHIPQQVRLQLTFALDFVLTAAVVVAVDVAMADLEMASSATLGVAAYGVSLGAFMSVIAMASGFYEAAPNRSIAQSCARALLCLVFIAPVAFVTGLLLPAGGLPDAALPLAAVLAACLVTGRRIYVAHSARPPSLRSRVLIVGAGDRAAAVGRTLQRADGRVDIVGYYPVSNETGAAVPEQKVFATYEPLVQLALRMKIDEVVVAPTERRGGGMPLRQLLDCKTRGVSVMDIATHIESKLEKIDLDYVNAAWLVFGRGFRQSWLRTAIKRTFDIVCACILIVAAAPVMVIAAVMIKLDSAGPAFYRQQRVGLNGRCFDVIKFRSMRTDAEKDGPRWAAQDDDRVTRVGRIIRRLRIDELPQLFTVLLGDMSIIGPRPERPVFVDQLAGQIPYYGLRHSIKPGVTGWAQVRYPYGATVEDARQKLQYDLYYIKNHTLLLDLLVLFETVAVVLTGDGAR